MSHACPCFTPVFTPIGSPNDDILSMDASSLSNAIEMKEVSCEALMQATLDRIDRINPKCNAIILLRDREELLEEARVADTQPRKGWLHGIPMAVKDISNVKGIPTTMGGSKLSQNFVPQFNDFYVENLIRAGAIIVGKTNAPENGLGSHTYNDQWGTTLNPFDLTKSAGGSSGGAGVAVASRMLCVSDGTDMMGSLRNPAGWNNIYSHRPTAGLIRGAPASKKNPLPYPTSTTGPMARKPMDCARLLEVMVGGKDQFDVASVPPEISFEGVRIGWLGDWGGSLPMEDGVLSLCRGALTRLEESYGANVTDHSEELFPLSQLWTSWNHIRFGTVAHMFSQSFEMEKLLKDSLIKPDLLWEIKQGLQVSDEDIAEAGRIRNDFAACLEDAFSKYDVLALPSAQLFPFPQQWKWPSRVGDTDMDTYHRWMQTCVPVTLAGLPCSTVPAGFGETGLPMGLQIFGQRGDDARVLGVAQAYHRAMDWPSQVDFSTDEDKILIAVGHQ